MFGEHEIAPVESPSFATILGSHLGSILNALTAVAIAALVVVFGLAPIRRALTAETPSVQMNSADRLLGASEAGGESEQEMQFPFNPMGDLDAPQLLPMGLNAPMFESPFELDAPMMRASARRKLEALIDRDDAHAAAIMKQWIRS
jgi:flagellar M-ring protein FliF